MTDFDLEAFQYYEEELEQINFSKSECFKCKASALAVQITMHEPLMGAKYRSLSIKYGLQVPLCLKCHEEVQTDPTQEYNRFLQKLMQRKFIIDLPNLSFMAIFGRNYLWEET